MPVMSISTTSPCLMSGEAPSVPIQITSPGHSVKYFVSSIRNGTTPKIMSAALLAIDPDDRFHLVEIGFGLDPRPHRLERVGVLRAPQAAVGLLPAALADVVADGVAEHAIHRILLGEMLHLLADH